MNTEHADEPILLRAMVLGTTAACGAMAGSLEALRAEANGFYFMFSWRTAVVFICSAGLVVWAWRIMLNETDTLRHRIARRTVRGLLIAIAAGAFLYPLRYVPKSRLPEIGISLGLATCALSIVGFLLFRAPKFLAAKSSGTGGV